MMITSLKSNTELYNVSASPFTIREGVTLQQYRLLIKETAFLLWLANSTIVASVVTLISVTASTLAAYAVARLRFRGAQVFGMAIFLTYLVPPTLLFIPLSRVVAFFGVSDSLWALILTYPTFLIPFGTWLQMGYFRPNEECSENRTLIKNLYLCGSSCYPGGLVTFGPSYIAAGTIANDLGVRKWWSEPPSVVEARKNKML